MKTQELMSESLVGDISRLEYAVEPDDSPKIIAKKAAQWPSANKNNVLGLLGIPQWSSAKQYSTA